MRTVIDRPPRVSSRPLSDTCVDHGYALDAAVGDHARIRQTSIVPAENARASRPAAPLFLWWPQGRSYGLTGTDGYLQRQGPRLQGQPKERAPVAYCHRHATETAGLDTAFGNRRDPSQTSSCLLGGSPRGGDAAARGRHKGRQFASIYPKCRLAPPVPRAYVLGGKGAALASRILTPRNQPRS